MYNTFEKPQPKFDKPQPKSKLQVPPKPFKMNSKKGMEEGVLWTLSSKSVLTSSKSRKRLALIEDFPEGEEEQTEEQAKEPHAHRTTTPFPIIGIAVPLWALPAVFVGSSIAGAVCMVGVQLPIVRYLLYSRTLTLILASAFGFLYIVTFGCMAYCMGAEPGLMQTVPSKLPDRAHKTWLYDRPIYRYDHYCRWLMNCIGLLNHREFMIMLIGLVVIAIAGACVDASILLHAWLYVEAFTGARLKVIAIVLHLVYSIAKARFVGEILRMHIGFVGRNELCSEWKEDIFWRVQSTSMFDGKMVKDMCTEELLKFEEGTKLDGMLVSELSVDTYNEMDPETNRYDPSLNRYDLGWNQNCLAFWLTPRWTKDFQPVF